MKGRLARRVSEEANDSLPSVTRRAKCRRASKWLGEHHLMSDSGHALSETAFDVAPDALIVVAPQGEIVLGNRRAIAWFGDFSPQNPARQVKSLFSDPSPLSLGGAGTAIVETVCRDRGGREFPVAVTAASVVFDGRQLQVLSIRDITAAKQSAEELQTRTRQQWIVSELGRLAMSGTDVGQLMVHAVELLHPALDVEYANVLELLSDGQVVFRAGAGWDKELIGTRTAEVVDQIPAAEVLLRQTPVIVTDLRTDPRFPGATLLRDHGVISSLTVGLLGQDRPFGTLGVHSTRSRPFTEDDVRFVQAVAHVLSSALERDWFEQRQRERYLQRAEQMAALGQVAAGIAHELRNPLTAIKGLIQVNLRKATAGSLPAGDLAVVEHEIRRMERTLQTFLDFARPPQPHRRELSLAEVVERVFSLVAGRARKQQVDLQFTPPETSPIALGDEDQLQQLLLNLVLNSLDVMPQGGCVTVEVRAIDDTMELSVRDTGPGIAPHILPKVFETFVSSKETGVGLGLPVSRRIAEEHGGGLAAYNLPGSGACFVLKLPAHPKPARTSDADSTGRR